MIQLPQPAQRARLNLFAEVVIARVSCRHWGTGRWLLGKGDRERKGWGRQSHGCDSELTSGTCRNRYIYGWRLCTVPDFPCPLEQGMSHFICAATLSQWSSMHINIQKYSLHTVTSEKSPDYFLQQANSYTRKILKLHRQLYLPFHDYNYLQNCKSFKLNINSCTITLWRLEYKMLFKGAMLSPLDRHYLFPAHLLQQVGQQAGHCWKLNFEQHFSANSGGIAQECAAIPLKATSSSRQGPL